MKTGVLENFMFALTHSSFWYSPDVKKIFSFGAARTLVTGQDKARIAKMATLAPILTYREEILKILKLGRISLSLCIPSPARRGVGVKMIARWAKITVCGLAY